MKPALLVGTSKGLVVFDNTSGGWANPVVHFEGLPVSMVFEDARNHTWWVSLSHRHWGEKLHHSDNRGKTWNEVGVPPFGGRLFRPGITATLRKIWVMQGGGKDHPHRLWLGTEPGGLFLSEDKGSTFTLVESLWNHPSRMDPHQWFGAGKDFPFIHSIEVDPRDDNHVYVAVSCAGVFETKDGGTTWQPCNQGLIAAYLPKPHPEVGHDPHRLLICAANPDVIWQQNHCGIFRTTNAGQEWKLVSNHNGFPHYGFSLAINHTNPDEAWVIPAQSDERRLPVDLHLRICHTIDAGKHWNSIDPGLPLPPHFDLVLRHGFSNSGDHMAFGTNNGNLYASADRGASWQVITHHLAPVQSVVLCPGQ
jgi:hypothetical protein